MSGRSASSAMTGPQPGLAPSAWVRRWSHLIPASATVLDVACGSGRHLRWFAARGCRVTGIDRDAAALAASGGIAERIVADIESGPWPCAGRRFDAVVVTNYLWRPRWPEILASVDANGVLIYETFAAGHETIGKPSNPDFLLRPGELISRVTSPDMSGGAAQFRVVAFEDVFETVPMRFVQRIIAVREPSSMPAVRRYPLKAPDP